MAKRKKNKSDAIRQQLTENPDKPAKDIAKELKVQPSLVYQVRSKMTGAGRRRKVKARKRRGPAAASDTTTNQVVAAANLIKSCGSLEQAREALKAAEKVAEALG